MPAGYGALGVPDGPGVQEPHLSSALPAEQRGGPGAPAAALPVSRSSQLGHIWLLCSPARSPPASLRSIPAVCLSHSLPGHCQPHPSGEQLSGQSFVPLAACDY